MFINIRAVCFAVSLIVLGASDALSQSTIWLVPSTETEAKGSLYAEFDLNSDFTSGGRLIPAPGPLVLGVNEKCEVGFSLALPRTDTAGEAQLNGKCRFFGSFTEGVSLAAGTIAYLPVVNRQYGDTFGLVYLSAGKQFQGRRAPVVSAGVWTLVGRQAGTGSRSGVMFGIDQPLTPWVSIAADWWSGNQIHGGYSAFYAGPQFNIGKQSVTGVAYTRGNPGTRHEGVFFYFGYSFAVADGN